MTISFRANEDGSASFLLDGTERLKLNADGSLSASGASAAGTRGNVLATMAAFSSEFTGQFNPAGWVRLPNGFIIQWGNAISDGSGMVTATFPIAFPTTILGFVCNGYVGGTTTGEAAGATWNQSQVANARTQVRLIGGRASASTFHYIALGL